MITYGLSSLHSIDTSLQNMSTSDLAGNALALYLLWKIQTKQNHYSFRLNIIVNHVTQNFNSTLYVIKTELRLSEESSLILFTTDTASAFIHIFLFIE